jgi:hypothetical protein
MSVGGVTFETYDIDVVIIPMGCKAESWCSGDDAIGLG